MINSPGIIHTGWAPRDSRFLLLLLSLVAVPQPSIASDSVPSTLLELIFPAERPRPVWEHEFRASVTQGAKDACGFKATDLVVHHPQNPPYHTYTILGDSIDEQAGPRQFYIRLKHITVDNDGSPRAYHPLDPSGNGHCPRNPDGTITQGICALDSVDNSGVALYKDSQAVPVLIGNDANPAYLTAWNAIWPLIDNGTLAPVDLKSALGEARAAKHSSSVLYYSENQHAAVLFNKDIIKFNNHKPCTRASDKPFPGYFVSQTSSSSGDHTCDAQGYRDASVIPYFVIPGKTFAHLSDNDIVIGYAKTTTGERVIYGIVGDRSSPSQIGEGSLAFNDLLMAGTMPAMNRVEADKRDIELPSSGGEGPGHILSMGVLVLGGTASEVGLPLTREKIQQAASSVFGHWGGAEGAVARLRKCHDNAIINSRP